MLTPLRTLATRTRPASRLPALLPRSLLSATFHSSPTPRRPSEPLPWFVDPSSAPSSLSPAAAPLATAPVPTLPPSHLSPALHPLHDHLSVSPFFDKEALTYIHAREKDPEGSWCDWVVIATLREGRERGIRGAAEGVRTFVRLSTMLTFLPSRIDALFLFFFSKAREKSPRPRRPYNNRRSALLPLCLLPSRLRHPPLPLQARPFALSKRRSPSNPRRASDRLGDGRRREGRRALYDEGGERDVWEGD